MDWTRVRLAIGQCNLQDSEFFASLAYWHTGELVTKHWTLESDHDLVQRFESDGPATVLVKGDCLADVTVPHGSLVHVYGDVGGQLTANGHAEVVIGGALRPDATIRGDGIIRVFIGEDVGGTLSFPGSSTIWTYGNFHGEVLTGHPSTNLHVLRDFHGNIRPVEKASLVYLDVQGFMQYALLERVAQHHYTVFNASVNRGDRLPGFYPEPNQYRELRKHRSFCRWTIHNQQVKR